MARTAKQKDDIAQRRDERLEKSIAYTANRTEVEKSFASAHAHAGNVADTVVTASGNKFVGAMVGGLWGALKGAMFSVAVFVVASYFFAPAAGILVGATMLYNVAKGVKDGYYSAEMHPSSRLGKRVGDSIAKLGNAQQKGIDPKIANRAREEANKVLPKKTAIDYQFSHGHHDHKDSKEFQGREIDRRSKQFGQDRKL